MEVAFFAAIVSHKKQQKAQNCTFANIMAADCEEEHEMPERRRRIEELCRQALDRDASERDAFLHEACGRDDELCREVESLLSQNTRAKDFLAQPAMHQVAKELDGDRLKPFAAGSQFGP